MSGGKVINKKNASSGNKIKYIRVTWYIENKVIYMEVKLCKYKYLSGLRMDRRGLRMEVKVCKYKYISGLRMEVKVCKYKYISGLRMNRRSLRITVT